MKLQHIFENDDYIEIDVALPFIPYINDDDVWDYADQQELETIMDISLEQTHTISKIHIKFQNEPEYMEYTPDALARIYKNDMSKYFYSENFIRQKFANNQLLMQKWLRYAKSIQ